MNRRRQSCAGNALVCLFFALIIFFRHPSQPPTEGNAKAAITLAGMALVFGFGWALTQPPPRRQPRPPYDRLRAVYRRSASAGQ